MPSTPASRRAFLAFLAASPVLAATGFSSEFRRRLGLGTESPESLLAFAQSAADRVAPAPSQLAAAGDALDVFDFEALARTKLPPAHWGYLATGTDDDGTIEANRDGYKRWAIRPRRLIDVTKVDPSVQLLGKGWPTPIVINPVGSQKAFHPEGEVAVARAAKALNHLMVLSTVATTSVEDASAARGLPVWFQLYHRADWGETKQLIQRAERAGCPAIVFTIDLLGGSNRLTMLRAQTVDSRDCSACHRGGRPRPGLLGLVSAGEDNRRKPMLSALEPVAKPQLETGTPTWEFVKRLKGSTTMKVILKGIVTKEDAELAVLHGVDGIFVSNHGGRAENSGRATITSLPEVVAGIRGRIPIVLDGGIRRGTDIFKALALGATATGIGRPYIWGLASFGQEGVETVLTILRRELELVMKQAGTVTVRAIGPASIARN
jgi:isopentenyl diphosphate isomerase/L-lactate dehydrogenase-like FMN-dependent dehydrogenase